MNRLVCLLISFSFFLQNLSVLAADTPPVAFRAPEVPLITTDPYFSIWSISDHLTDSNTQHWTGRDLPISGLIRIDGKTFRFLGSTPATLPALAQVSTEVQPTRTICVFSGEGIRLDLTFMTPALPDVEFLSRPITYLTWKMVSTDHASHEVSLYVDASAALSAEELDVQKVVPSRPQVAGLDVLRVGTEDQNILARHGDGVRIDWGYLYLAATKNQECTSAVAPADQARTDFENNGKLIVSGDSGMPRTVSGGAPVLAFSFDAGEVGVAPVTRWMMFAYDQIYSASYFFNYLRPYWRRHGEEAADLLKLSAKDYPSLVQRCEDFDHELTADLVDAGGKDYANLASLAYRQTWAANVICADSNGQPLMFSKENSSNGCMATVDVFYPMAPLPLLFGPTLTKSMLIPELDYGSSRFWTAPYAPHDMGSFPRAYVPNYGDMPVEESGNMLILMAAVAEMEGNADFAGKYWPTLQKWAEYLRDKGYDPANQICTDDFKGPLAHQTNLSIKAITGLASWGYLCGVRGDIQQATEYNDLAKKLAARWMKDADDGDHYRLAFDKPGTWGQKYNLVWDQLLGFGLFPAEVRAKELAFYKTKLTPNGLPLDYRNNLTKTDWSVWSACLAENQADFEPFITAINRYLSTTDQHYALTDLYDVQDINKRPGFTARPVVGAIFMRALQDHAVWKKWILRDHQQTGSWAPLPNWDQSPIAPADDTAEVSWRYTDDQPTADWAQAGFDDTSWKTGLGGFGNQPPLRGMMRTQDWKGPDIWLRREVNLSHIGSDLRIWARHDGYMDVYLNGVLAVSDPETGLANYYPMPLRPEALAVIRPGRNIMAVHAYRPDESDHREPNRFVDAGIVTLVAHVDSPNSPVGPTSATATFLEDLDINNPGTAGSGSYANGIYTIKGSGGDIWYSNDQFHFEYRSFTGNGAFIVHTLSESATSYWAKAGLMVREDLTPGSRMAMAVATNHAESQFNVRTVVNQNAATFGDMRAGAGLWYKLVRSGDTITAYTSKEGANWATLGGPAILTGLARKIYVGMAVVSTDESSLNTSNFSNFAVGR